MSGREMTRREFLTATAGAAAGATVLGWLDEAAGEAPTPQGKKPNIVLIMADDLGYECLGSYGGTSYKTPNLDALAAGGLRFADGFCMPLCSPTRIQLMTGRYSFRNYKGWGILDPREKTFAHVLKAAGYATCVSGKWQLCRFDQPGNADHCTRAGFDEHCVWTWQFGKVNPSRYWNPSIWQNGKMLEGAAGKFGPDVHCDYICDFIARNKDRPFFAYYSQVLVHSPLVETPDTRKAGAAPAGGKKGQAKAGKFPGMVEYMDKMVGRVVATLDRLNLRENTLVLFTADNGTARGITSMAGGQELPGGKGLMTDLGTHVPLIANWKGTTPSGKVCEDLVDLSDVLPTLAEMGGAALPAGVTIDGRSFLPQLRGQPGRAREWVYLQLTGQRALREKRWKLYNDGRLFDLKTDPFEKKPVAPDSPDPEAAAARKRLAAVFADLKTAPVAY